MRPLNPLLMVAPQTYRAQRVVDVGGRYTKVDGRSAMARRAKELIAEWSSILGGADALDVAMMRRIKRAAEFTAIADGLRLATMRVGAEGADDKNLDNLVRIENLAARALAALKLKGEAEPERERESGQAALLQYAARKAGSA